MIFSIPSTRHGHSRRWAALLLLMLGYAALFLAYYPPFVGIEDEGRICKPGARLVRGVLTSDAAGWPDLADFAFRCAADTSARGTRGVRCSRCRLYGWAAVGECSRRASRCTWR